MNMMYCFMSTLCSYLHLTAFLWISVVCIEEFEWKRDYELDDRTVTSHVMSCHDVTTVTECLKDCSTHKLCHSVFVYKPNMSCCLNKMPVYTVSTSQTAPGHVHYVSSYEAEKKAMMPSTAATSETTAKGFTNLAVAPISSEDDDEATTDFTFTAEGITTEAASTPQETTGVFTTSSTTTEAETSVLSDGFINVPSIHLTFRAITTELGLKDAQKTCEQNSGHLIYLNTEAKQNYITEYLGNTGISAEFHIGAYMANAITPTWLDGSVIVNPPWAPNEPHNNAKCISMIIPSGEWKDDDCDIVKQYICEK